MTDLIPNRKQINHALLEQAKSLRGQQVTQNANQQYDEAASLGDRVSDKLSALAGSWAFIISFMVIILGWTLINSFLLTNQAFDPYPFVFLNLVLSMLAAIQAPVIMISQNRQSEKDRLKVDLDYHVNLKAEAEIATLHHKLDMLREEQWAELVAMQQEQIKLLQGMVAQLADTKR